LLASNFYTVPSPAIHKTCPSHSNLCASITSKISDSEIYIYFLIYFCPEKPFSQGGPYIFPKIFLTQVNKVLLFYLLRPMIQHDRPEWSYCCWIETYS
jgi:hypothetical protein